MRFQLTSRSITLSDLELLSQRAQKRLVNVQKTFNVNVYRQFKMSVNRTFTKRSDLNV